MAIKDRISRIEANAKVSPQLGAAAWWGGLLAKPKENEARICAATMMAFNCLIQPAPARAWASLESIYKQDPEKLTDSQLAFAGFFSLGYHEDEERDAYFEEMFGTDDGKEWLCHMATIYWDTFKTAPLVPNPQIEKDGKGRLRAVMLGHLRHDFTRPLFERIFPDEGSHRYGRFEEWLEKDGQCESLLADARAFMGIAQGVTP